MKHDDIKKQLMSRVDKIVEIIVKDKNVEIKRTKNGIQVFEIDRRKID